MSLMKGHVQTRRGREIERLIYDRVRTAGLSESELMVQLPASQSGVRNALLRMQARGLVACALDASVPGYPRRVWTVKTSTPATAVA